MTTRKRSLTWYATALGIIATFATGACSWHVWHRGKLDSYLGTYLDKRLSYIEISLSVIMTPDQRRQVAEIQSDRKRMKE